MMRRATWSYCAAAAAVSTKVPETKSKSPTPINPAVLRTIYRAMIKEARKMDNDPLLKVLFPIPRLMQPLVGLDHALLVPDGTSYVATVRRCFREHSTDLSLTGTFEILNRARFHNEEVSKRLQDDAKERERVTAALLSAAPAPGVFHARIARRRDDGTRVVADSPSSSSSTVLPTYRAESSSVPIKVKEVQKGLVARRKVIPLVPGTGLIAHPLSSSHGDRRVMMVTEQTHLTTTALVLDMVYAYPMSGGNPMFPEVFWGHEVYNGGFLHVDFTMPPTAHVAVLHTLAPPSSPLLETIQRDDGAGGAYHRAWTKWMKTRGTKLGGGSGGGAAASFPSIVDHHEQLCKPLIRGVTRADGTSEPTLYYSKVEALPYLSHLAAGQPRSSLRIYWGCMQWPTSQINNEVANGHWIPVELSPSFFAGYPLSGTKASRRSGRIVDRLCSDEGDAYDPLPAEDRFPTLEELSAAKSLRMKHFDIDIVSPQVFPPDQPICRREPLWDQIMLSLGGEFKSLVGASNPFSRQPGHRFPPSEIVAPDDVPDLSSLPLLISPDDDDDD